MWPPPPFDLPEALSDQAAAELAQCLYEFAAYVESRYFAQIKRYYASEMGEAAAAGLVRRHHRDNGLTQARGRLGSEVCAHGADPIGMSWTAGQDRHAMLSSEYGRELNGCALQDRRKNAPESYLWARVVT